MLSRCNSGSLSRALVALGWLAAWGARPAWAEILNVPDEYETIQQAINAAQDGDEIIVAPGTFFERIHLLSKAITIRSSGGPDLTVIDATGLNQAAVTCTNQEGPDTRLVGFTVTGGTVGMLIEDSAPTVANCVFTENDGDGMYCDAGDPILTKCRFALNGGCGLYSMASGPGLEGCAFTQNALSGMSNKSLAGATLRGCTFAGNTASLGGGMRNVDSCTAVLIDCTFTENHASHFGGGMFNDYDCSPTLTNCTFRGNSTLLDGGGMCNVGGESGPTVTNCTFSGNSAIRNGGGMSNWGGAPTVANCILWGNEGGEIHDDASSSVVTYCDVQGGYEGLGNIDTDPLFVDAENGDLHLSPGSPCIDAGDNTAVPEDVLTDLDGNGRFVDDPDTEDTGYGQPPIVDMGAYEFQGPDCPADFNDDGLVDTADLLILLASWGTPDGDVDGDGDTDTWDLLALLGAWGACP